jgi:ABC transporter DrrB family efflux protein
MNGFLAVMLKEFSHIRRDRGTVFFAFVVPALQMTIFGFAIDVTIEHIPLVVLDLDGRQESRRLVDALVNTRTFDVIERVYGHDSFRGAIDAGRAKAGVLIPPDYSDDLLRGEQAHVQFLVDGSDSQVATTAMNTANLLITRLAIQRARAVGERAQMGPARGRAGELALPIEVRVRLLYNPDLESSHFFVPGLIAIILQLVLLFLTSFSIVRERELGSLEQLFVTPVSPAGLLLGKLAPYCLMAFGELLIVLVLMTTVFGVPIRGGILELIVASTLFIVTVLGLGLLISTIARTQLEALQMSFLIMLPSVLLSGFMFPRAEMPGIIYAFSFVLPVTYFIEILRGIILRGVALDALLPHIMGLSSCCLVILGLSLTRFRKQLD